MKKVLIVCAMPKEAIRIVEKLKLNKKSDEIYESDNISLIITGIGKQKTAIRLTKYLCENCKK